MMRLTLFISAAFMKLEAAWMSSRSNCLGPHRQRVNQIIGGMDPLKGGDEAVKIESVSPYDLHSGPSFLVLRRESAYHNPHVVPPIKKFGDKPPSDITGGSRHEYLPESWLRRCFEIATVMVGAARRSHNGCCLRRRNALGKGFHCVHVPIRDIYSCCT